MSKPVVAIVGRQNVGKSTLLNRLAGKPLAIVEDLPGTTRDRIFANISWQGFEFTVVDTGGLELESDSAIGRGVREQVGAAVTEADVIVFLVDVQSGVMASDLDVADILRRDLDGLTQAGTISVESMQAMSAQMISGLEISIRGDSYEDVALVATQLSSELESMPDIAGLETEFDIPQPKIIVEPDMVKVMTSGLSLEQIQGLEKLDTLVLKDTAATGEGFHYLQPLKNLRTLNVDRCESIEG